MFVQVRSPGSVLPGPPLHPTRRAIRTPVALGGADGLTDATSNDGCAYTPQHAKAINPKPAMDLIMALALLGAVYSTMIESDREIAHHSRYVPITLATSYTPSAVGRSEERRVGKECRSRWS